ncbi:MAG: MATE family efflux transporter [Bdellovibrionales bacterium]|nr:MATE family efflux transporter [Bdellovibrionales bacterium]
MKNHWRRIFAIAWPLIVANSFWTLQMTIDRVFLGSFSTVALGAAMAVMAVFWTPMALLQQSSSYVTTFVAQYSGSGQKSYVGTSLWQGIYFSILGGSAFLFLNPVSGDFFRFVGHDPEIQNFEILYFNAISYSALPTALVAAFSGFFTGLGRTRIVMAINGVGLVLNALLDYLLIYGNLGFPKLGIAGAGYATAIAGYGSVVFAAFFVFNSQNQSEFQTRSSWRWNSSIMRRYIRYGLPSGLQWALEGLAFTVFLIAIGRFSNGSAALAASSISVTLMMLAVLPPMGVAQSIMALTGQHIGEKRPDLAVRDTYIGVQMSALYIFVVGLTFILFPNFYLMWFENQHNADLWSEVSSIVKVLLVFVAIFTLFDSINFNISFALKGAGDTRFVSLVSLFLPWPVFVIPTLFLKEQANAIYWAWGFVTVYGIFVSCFYFVRFKLGKWKKMSIF